MSLCRCTGYSTQAMCSVLALLGNFKVIWEVKNDFIKAAHGDLLHEKV